MTAPIRAVAVIWLTVITGAACGGGDIKNDGGNGPGTSIAKAAPPNGDTQTDTVGAVLPESLRVVVSESGLPAAGVTITWSTTTSLAAVSPATSVTDADGKAATQFTLGHTVGAQTARAALAAAPSTFATFTSTATVGSTSAFSRTAGDNQTVAASTAFPVALAVKVADGFGNGVAGVTTTWTVISGGVTLAAGTTAVTNASGIATKVATATATTGAALVGVTTTAVPATQLNFSLSVGLPPIAVTLGNVFFRSDRNNSEDPAVDTTTVGRPVLWTNTTGGHTVRSGNTTWTESPSLNVVGEQFTVTFASAGTFQYDCGVHGSDMTGRIVVLP